MIHDIEDKRKFPGYQVIRIPNKVIRKIVEQNFPVRRHAEDASLPEKSNISF